MPSLPQVLGTLMLVYVAIGLLVAMGLVLAGPQRLLAEPQPVSAGARLLLVPGAVLLWPLLVRRWLARRTAGDPS